MRCGEYVGRNQTIGGNQTNRPRSCHTWPRSLTALTWTVALSKTRHRDLFLGELPAVGDTRQQRNTALVAVQQINLHSRSICTAGQSAPARTGLAGLAELRASRRTHRRWGCALVSGECVCSGNRFFRNRRRVSCENSLPSSCSISASARLIFWRLLWTARRTAARSVSACRMDLRPRLALVCRPAKP